MWATLSRFSLVLLFTGGFSFSTTAETLVVDGNSLTLEALARVAQDETIHVELDEKAQGKILRGFSLILTSAMRGDPVYGLTVGVGWNKDRPVFDRRKGEYLPDEDLLAISRSFNLGALRAHAGGLGEAMPVEVVRAGLLIRLNQMATGLTGTQPEIVDMYRLFLNHGITPVVPARGSVGEGDITLAAHIGLAMIGEGEVFYKGYRRAARDVLDEAGIAVVEPVGKDFLSIVSNNALTAGRAALLAWESDLYLRRAAVLFALALEGFNGNVSPFLEETTAIRPFIGMMDAAAMIRHALEGSDLWRPDPGRLLQDPLSYRTMAYVLGNAIEAQRALRDALLIQINHVEDNPTVIPGMVDRYPGNEPFLEDQELRGAIYPTANFTLFPVVSQIERLAQSLAQLSQSVVMQTIRFENTDLTRLPRFLAAEGNRGHAFGAMQKPLVALYVENRQLAEPVSLVTFAMAGNTEDVSSNAPQAVDNLARLLDNMYALSSIQLLHAAQAVDLRGWKNRGRETSRLLRDYRDVVPFVTQDRAYSSDFSQGINVLRSFLPGFRQGAVLTKGGV